MLIKLKTQSGRQSTPAPTGPSGLEKFIPRSSSQSVFLFVVYCYSCAVATLETRLIDLFHLWPTVENSVTHLQRPLRLGVDGANIFDLLILSPVGESLFLIAVIEILRKLRLRASVQVAGATATLCLMHSARYPMWGLLVIPTFFLGALSYLWWRRVSLFTGLRMVVALHMLVNALPAFSLFVQRIKQD